MEGKCKLSYTDDEGASSIKSVYMQDYLKEHSTEHHRTRGHAQFSEPGVRIFKDALYKRVEADENKGTPNTQWTDYIIYSWYLLVTTNIVTRLLK